MRNQIQNTREEFGDIPPAGEVARYRRLSESGRKNGSHEDRQRIQALGWLSIGLGLAALAAPRSLSEWIGIRNDHRSLVRIIGVREVASGIGLLSGATPTPWILSRVAGDLLDLALLGSAFSADNADRKRLAAASAAVAGVTLLDIHHARKLALDSSRFQERSAAITINRPPQEVYRYWRDLRNLPRFMAHLESVQVSDERHSHWVARGPAGMTVAWDARIIVDLPDKRIAWRSLENSQVHNTGEVRFKAAPAGRGTEVHVRIAYAPPGGALGSGVASLFGREPGQQIRGDLYRFKQVMETGEVLHSDSSIHRGLHPAQPSRRAGSGRTLPKHSSKHQEAI